MDEIRCICGCNKTLKIVVRKSIVDLEIVGRFFNIDLVVSKKELLDKLTNPTHKEGKDDIR